MISSQVLKDRFRGAIVGTAVGDALGAPFEGRPTVGLDELRTWEEASEPLRWTDDTAMTLEVARSLTANHGFDGPDLARRFADAYDAEPWRGYGAGPPRIFDALRRGAAWDGPARRLFGGQGSFGNGAAMRAAPVGLWCFRDLRHVTALARDCARITHAHELGLQGAAVQAYAASWLATANPNPRWWTADSLLDDLRGVADADGYRRRLDTIAELPGTIGPSFIRDALGNGIAAVEAVSAALCVALRHLDFYAGAVTQAVRVGGDTDTIAAMVGALVGAHAGHQAIPERWRQRVEQHDDLVATADALFDACLRTGPATC